MSDLKDLSKLISELEKTIADNAVRNIDTTKETERLNTLLEVRLDIEKELLDLKEKQKFYTTEDFKIELRLKDAIKTRVTTSKVFVSNEEKLKNLKKEQTKLNELLKNANVEEKKFLEEKLKDNQKNYATLKETNDMIGKTVKNARTLAVVSNGVGGIVDGFTMMYKYAKQVFDYVSKIWNDFDKVDRAVRDISVNMGLTSSQMATFSKNTAYAAVETAKLGIGVEEVIKLQQSMAENLGRNLILTQEQIKGIAEMAKGTSLGVDGVATLAEGFDSFGINLDSMRNRVEDVFKSTQKLGLNSAKVFKLISENLKTAQKYNFKDGTKGLEEMAKKAASIKMDLGGVFGLAEKLFDVEGAVNLSAELQVLGGSFAKLADPFQLMFQARNDVDGLTTSLIEATKNVAMFDKATGEFKIPAMELHRLRKVAEATSISLENLVEPALQLAKQDKAMSQLANAFKYTPEQRQAIANLAQVGKDGVLEIVTSDGTKKALSALDPTEINKILGRESSLEQAAKSRMTFLDMLKNIGNVFTAKLFPVLESISKRLMEGGLIDKLQTVADKIAGFLSDLFTSDKVDNMIKGAKSFIDSVMTLINDVLSGKGSFTEKIISLGAQLIGAIFKEAVSMFIQPLIYGGIGALIGGGIGGAFFGPAGAMLGARLGGTAGTLFGGAQMVNDVTVLPNSKLISQVTPNGGLKPLAVTSPQDTIMARKNPYGGNNSTINVNFSTLTVDLGMGVKEDFRREMLNDAKFRRQITATVKDTTVKLMNGVA